MIRNNIRNIIDSIIYYLSFFVVKNKSTKRKVLIIRKDVVGDFVIFYPTIRYYRDFYAKQEISFLCSVVLKDLTFLLEKVVDNIIWYDEKKFRNNFFYRARFLLNLKRQGFDIVIYPVYTRELAGDNMVRITGAKEKIGFDSPEVTSEKTNTYYTKRIQVKEGLNEFDRNFAFVSTLFDIQAEPTFPTIDISLFPKEEYEYFLITNQKIISNQKYIVITPGSNLAFKMWPAERFASIINHCTEKELIVILSGVKSEIPLGEKILSLIKSKEKVINTIGKTKLSTLFYIINNASFYFGNDTGTLHIAASLGVPSLAIMGGGHFGRFFPYGDLSKNKIISDPHAPCRGDNWKCLNGSKKDTVAPCINSITVESVKEALDAFL